MTDNIVTCRYGIHGHESEWVVMIEGFHHANYIPPSISDDLQIYIPTSAVLNRGNRIEIITDDGSEEMKNKILRIISETFLARPWIEEMRNRKELRDVIDNARRKQIEHDKRIDVQLLIDDSGD